LLYHEQGGLGLGESSQKLFFVDKERAWTMTRSTERWRECMQHPFSISAQADYLPKSFDPFSSHMTEFVGGMMQYFASKWRENPNCYKTQKVFHLAA